MSDKNILQQLNSINRYEILDALFKIKENTECLSQEIISIMRKFVFDIDEDIQEEVILILGLRLHEESVCTDLIKILESEELKKSNVAPEIEQNISMIIRSLGSMAIRYKKYQGYIIKTLTKLVFNENLNPEDRGLSYKNIVNFFNICNSKKPDFSLPEDIRKMNVDWIWLDKLLIEFSMEKHENNKK